MSQKHSLGYTITSTEHLTLPQRLGIKRKITASFAMVYVVLQATRFNMWCFCRLWGMLSIICALRASEDSSTNNPQTWKQLDESSGQYGMDTNWSLDYSGQSVL